MGGLWLQDIESFERVSQDGFAYFEGRTQAEIASRLGVPLGTVKARMARGMHRLAEIVVKEDRS